MNAAVYLGDGRVEAREWPVPVIGPGELLMRLRGCGLCGSDIVKILQGTVTPPAVFGHEVVGEVVEVGKGVEGISVMDRVVVAHHVPCQSCHFCRRGSHSMCRAFKAQDLDPGGFAELIRVPPANVQHATFRLPAGMSDEAASFTEPLACCLRAVKRSGVGAGDSALVVGMGSIGLQFVQLFHRIGVAVFAAEPLPSRRALGESFGAIAAESDEALGRLIREATDGRGADLLMLTGGGVEALREREALVRDGGQIHFFAGGEGAHIPIPLDRFYYRELTLTATYSSSPAELGEAFDLLRRGEVKVERLITHRLPLGRLGEAVQMMRSREALKVFITGEAG